MEKKIKIRTQTEKKHFLSMLPLYRSILYKRTLFKIDTNDLDIKEIESALNIKNKKARITYIYDTTCKKIEDFYKDNKNMCGFICGQCYTQREGKSNKTNGCCRYCLYQSDKGCTTANLACKFFNCENVRKRYKVLEFSDIDLLKVLKKREQEIIKSDYFSLREDVIKDASLGYILGTIRIYYRLIKNLIIFIFRKE